MNDENNNTIECSNLRTELEETRGKLERMEEMYNEAVEDCRKQQAIVYELKSIILKSIQQMEF